MFSPMHFNLLTMKYTQAPCVCIASVAPVERVHKLLFIYIYHYVLWINDNEMHINLLQQSPKNCVFTNIIFLITLPD